MAKPMFSRSSNMTGPVRIVSYVRVNDISNIAVCISLPMHSRLQDAFFDLPLTTHPVSSGLPNQRPVLNSVMCHRLFNFVELTCMEFKWTWPSRVDFFQTRPFRLAFFLTQLFRLATRHSTKMHTPSLPSPVSSPLKLGILPGNFMNVYTAVGKF